jgi:hypothetical protein
MKKKDKKLQVKKEVKNNMQVRRHAEEECY